MLLLETSLPSELLGPSEHVSLVVVLTDGIKFCACELFEASALKLEQGFELYIVKV